MSKWTLTPPLPGEDPAQALSRLAHDLNLILAEQEQLDLQSRGDGGYITQRKGPLDMAGHQVTGLPSQPQDDSAACSLHFHKSGRMLYTEGDSFSTDKTIQHAPATQGNESTTFAQLQDFINTALKSIMPRGVIVQWHDTIATIPAGWLFCDGTNGTPDMRNVFMVGAQQDQAGVAKTNVTGALTTSGGSANSTPAGTISAIDATTTAAHTTLSQAGQNDADQVHTHPAPTFTGTAGSTLPPYGVAVWMMKT